MSFLSKLRGTKKKTSGGYGGEFGSYGYDDYNSYDDWESSSDKKKRQEKERKQKRNRILTRLSLVLGIGLVGVLALTARDNEVGDANQEALKALASPTATLVAPESNLNEPNSETVRLGGDTAQEDEPEVAAPEEETVQPSSEVTPTPPPIESDHDITANGVLIHINAEGIPMGYTLSDGTQITFTPEEQAEFAELRETAISGGEPEIITSIDTDADDDTDGGTPDRPLVPELPNDVLTETELQGFGIVEIIQADNTNFHIRASAFEPGGIMENLPAGLTAENPVNLRIVFVNGPLISQNYMTDSRYDSVRDLVPFVSSTDIEAFRAEQIATYQEGLDQLRSDPNATPDLLLVYKNTIHDFETMSDDAIMSIIVGRGDNAAGLFVPGIFPDENGVRTGTIFVATGHSEAPRGTQMKLYFDENGEVRTRTTIAIGGGSDFRPDPDRAFPRPDDFTRNDRAQRANNDYPYGAQGSPGQTLDHEWKHFELMMLEPALNGESPNNNEYDTDEAAMDEIEAQYQAWEASGYTDTSAYPWVFTVPEEKGGGYMLTDYVDPNARDEVVYL